MPGSVTLHRTVECLTEQQRALLARVGGEVLDADQPQPAVRGGLVEQRLRLRGAHAEIAGERRAL